MTHPTQQVVNVHEAKTHLSRLLAQVANGHEIVIGRAGIPVARLVPYRTHRSDRTPGILRGDVWIAPDFDESIEIERLFAGDDA